MDNSAFANVTPVEVHSLEEINEILSKTNVYVKDLKESVVAPEQTKRILLELTASISHLEDMKLSESAATSQTVLNQLEKFTAATKKYFDQNVSDAKKIRKATQWRTDIFKPMTDWIIDTAETDAAIKAAARRSQTCDTFFSEGQKINYFPKSITDAIQKKNFIPNGSEAWTIAVEPILMSLLQFGFYDYLNPSDLTKDDWTAGIDLSNAILYPLMHCLSSDEITKRIPKNAYDTLHAALCESTRAALFSSAFITHTLNALFYPENGAQSIDIATHERLLKKANKETKTAQKAVAEQKYQYKILSEKLKKAQEKANNADAAIRKATTEQAHDLQKEIKERDEYIARLEQQIEKLQAAPPVILTGGEAGEKAAPWLDQELPETGVLFLGGHPNMVKKIRNNYRKWLFVDSNQFIAGTGPNTKIVFFWTEHASHSYMWNIYRKIPSDAEILYVSDTNIPKLEENMKREYWMYLQRKKAQAEGGDHQ